ncbi:MAG TPA: nitroreductase family protein [Thermomicrobiaceae bacterium]|nr:nitroreductase family protein [Thermomicrobiaceae bacterium]
MKLNLTPDELLTTTRSVRKRLDLGKPVEREVIEECLRIAQQAPTGSNRQNWSFVVVTDPAKKQGLADCYRRGWLAYTRQQDANPQTGEFQQADHATTQARVRSSSSYLAEHMGDVPVLVVPCISPRLPPDASTVAQAAVFGSIVPATWSFMLAARERGLGTVYTTLHLPHEREAAEILGIPYDQVMQTALIPVAYTKGTDFQPAPRAPLATMVHWNEW